MSLGNKLTQTVLLKVLADAWCSGTQQQFVKYFDTLETADEADLDNHGTWPVIEDQIIDLVVNPKAGQADPVMQIAMHIELRDPWLSANRRKHICLIDIGMLSNESVISIKSQACTQSIPVKPRCLEFTASDFAEVCAALIALVDHLREEYRVNFNGKRLNHWYKQSSLIWDTCQAQRLPGNKHFITASSKRRANPDNAVIRFDNVPPYAVRGLVERLFDTCVFNSTQARIMQSHGDFAMVSSIVKTLIAKKQMKFGAFVKYMTEEI